MKKTTTKTCKQYQTTKNPGFIQPWFIFNTPFFKTLYTRSFKVRFYKPKEIGDIIVS